MQTTFRLISVALFLALSALSASAQTLINNTTLGAAVTSSQTFVTVASITTITLNDVLYVDNEVMVVTATPTAGTLRVTVRRGAGTGVSGIAQAHASGNVVFTGPSGQRWHQTDPDFGSLCIRGQQQFLPWFNITTGVEWSCGFLGNSTTASLTWRAYNPILAYTYNSVVLGELEESQSPWFSLPSYVRGWLGH